MYVRLHVGKCISIIAAGSKALDAVAECLVLLSEPVVHDGANVSSAEERGVPADAVVGVKARGGAAARETSARFLPAGTPP